MAGRVDGRVSAIYFYFVGIVRAGGRAADIDLAVGGVESTSPVDNGARQRRHAGKVSKSTPRYKLSTRASNPAANDDAFLGVRDVGFAVSTLALALERVLDGKEVVAFVRFGDSVTVVKVKHERVVPFRQVGLRGHRL